MTSEVRNALAIGFPIQSQFDPKGDVIDKQRELASTKRLNLGVWLVDALNEPSEAILQTFKAKLQERNYAVISIGFGIRGNRDLTPLFEQMVNLAIELQPAAKLAFANWPDDVVSACERVLGVAS